MGNHEKILGKSGEETGEIYKITRKLKDFENITGNIITFYRKKNVNIDVAREEQENNVGVEMTFHLKAAENCETTYFLM